MAQRTIQSPGVEIRESDVTVRGIANVGTNVYVTGFAQQGPIDEVLLISSKQDQLQIFGPPTTSAERYFHHTVSEVLNSPANVYATRLPYGPGKGDGFGSKYSALAYPVSAVENTGANSGANGGIATLNFAHSGVYVLGAPLHIELTQSQYLSCVNGTAFNWSNTGGSVKTLTNNAHSTAGVLSSLGSAGVIVLNKSQTTIDGSFQGYYVGLVDNSSLNPAANFESIKRVYAVNTTGGTVNSVISGGEYVEVPASTLQFATTANYKTGSTNSVSEVMENLTEFEINGGGSRDVLSLGVLKLRKSIYADEAFKLDYVVEDGIVGSVNYYRTELNQQGGPALSYFLGNKSDTSRNVKVLVNDNISNRLSGGDALNSDNEPTKWVRVYNSNVGSLMTTAAGRAEAGFNNSTYVTLSTTLGSGSYPVSSVHSASPGPDGGHLYPLGAFSNAKISDKEIGAVPDKIDRALDRIKNDEVYNIDVVCEGGLGTIFATSCAASTSYFDEYNTDVSLQQAINGLRTSNDISGDSLTLRNNYNSVFNKFNNFCKPPYLAGGSRGDCIFIADVFRQTLITGQNTKVLDNQDLNFQQDVLWPIRHQFESQNTSYAAVYGQWAQVYDQWIGQNVWVPFSGYAAAVMARTDAVAHPWIAPAGFTRGTIDNAIDIALNPNQKQRDELYKASVNPVAFFPGQGQVVFGQKTLSKKPSAFDRINVRRLFLALERPTKQLTRNFVFEPNNEFTRTRIINVLTPIFENARVTGGLHDYLIVCDERNNPEATVDANELKVDIYIKPVRTAEFILVSFFATRTNQSFQELVGGGTVEPAEGEEEG